MALPSLPAHAHAKLLRSLPAQGEPLKDSPADLRLYFTEDVGLEFSSARLLDRERRELPVGPPGHDGQNSASLVVPLPRTLPTGSYVLVWRVVSGVDGHLTLGTLAFTVGDVPPGEAPIDPGGSGGEAGYSTTAAQNADPVRWLARALILACAAFLLGGSIFTVLVIEPSSAEFGDRGARLAGAAGQRFASIAAPVAALLLVALVYDLLAQVSLILGIDLASTLGRGETISLLLGSTRFGFAWIMKAAGAALIMALMLSVWAFGRRGGSGLWEIGIAAGSLLLLAQALSSHAAAAVNYGALLGLPLPLISDWLHLVTVATWTGGLGYIVFCLFPAFGAAKVEPGARGPFLGASIPRFSRLAIASVVTLGLTGTFNFAIHTTDLGLALSTSYGQVLLVKIGLFCVLVALGAVNLRRVSPLLREAKSVESKEQGRRGTANNAPGPVAALKRNVRLEVGLALGAFVLAGGLTLLPPPPSGAEQLTNPGSANQVREATAPVGGGAYTATLTLAPGTSGDMTLTVQRAAPAAQPLTDVQRLVARLTPQEGDVESVSLETAPAVDPAPEVATWRIRADTLAGGGPFLLNLLVQRSEGADLRAAFRTVATGEGVPVPQVAQVLQIRLGSNPSPPEVGPATLTVTLLDDGGAPVVDTEVSVLARTNTGQQLSEVAARAGADAGTYEAVLHFPESGAWTVVVSVRQPGRDAVKMDFALDVSEVQTPSP